jgi:hypothetical protein
MTKHADANLVRWIEHELNGEPIEGVVIGEKGWSFFDSPRSDYVGKLLTWEQAKPILDYNFDSDFGSPGCHAIYLWTPTRVVCIHEYDGSTSLRILPRHPIAIIPEF